MSKKSIHIKHQDDINKKLTDKLLKSKYYKITDENATNEPLSFIEFQRKISEWRNEGYIKALKWVLGLNWNDEEFYNDKEDENE